MSDDGKTRPTPRPPDDHDQPAAGFGRVGSDEGERVSAYRSNLRDRIAVRLSNMMLSLATDHYRRFVRGSIEYGMRAAKRDQEAGTPPPEDWRVGAWVAASHPPVAHVSCLVGGCEVGGYWNPGCRCVNDPDRPHMVITTQAHGADRAPDTDRSEDDD